MASKYHVRSVSFPSRSYPAIQRIEQELDKLNQWEVSSNSISGSICNGLSGLEDFIARDILLRFREQVQALQSAFRRRKGDSSIESSVATFTCFRKKMKRDAKKLIASLKQMDKKLGASSLLDQDRNLSELMLKEGIACEEKRENEIETAGAALSEVSGSEKVKNAQMKLEALEMSIYDLENCLERLFRPLVKSRSSLLNIISQ
ncbi:hypothetical protein OIU85_019035 [Salix viminalis]|uniref:Uncharacterized protein n=1 Tax=Salix viminalis TaxID=40686 RepID=A0A9Q0UUZ6_SALVM|nr:hypothetical protein OIU85_019035 [Salix viminalis]